MKISLVSVLLAAALFVSPILSTSGSYAADSKEVRFSAYYPEHYPVFKNGWKPWEEKVQKESKGAFTFTNYLNGVLHAAKHGFKATKDNVCDITTGYPSYSRSSFNLALVNDLPFLFDKTYTGPLIMETLYPKYFKGEYEKLGGYLAAWVNVSGYNLISKKPVTKLEDFKGMKIRSIGGVCSEFLEALGAVPVMIQNAESYSALQSGVVDGVLLASGPIEAMKLFENAKYLVKLNIMHMGIPYVLNKKFFNDLTKEQKAFFYKELRIASQMASQAYDIEDGAAEKRMKAAGVQIVELSPAELAKVKEAVKPVREKFIADNEKKGLPVRAMMAEIDKLNNEYKNLSPKQALELVTKKPIQGIINF